MMAGKSAKRKVRDGKHAKSQLPPEALIDSKVDNPSSARLEWREAVTSQPLPGPAPDVRVNFQDATALWSHLRETVDDFQRHRTPRAFWNARCAIGSAHDWLTLNVVNGLPTRPARLESYFEIDGAFRELISFLAEHRLAAVRRELVETLDSAIQRASTWIPDKHPEPPSPDPFRRIIDHCLVMMDMLGMLPPWQHEVVDVPSVSSGLAALRRLRHYLDGQARTVPADNITRSFSLPDRPAAARDHAWLAWSEAEGLGPADIRDRWNALSAEQRRAISPSWPQPIGTGESGRDTVKKAIGQSRNERDQLTKS